MSSIRLDGKRVVITRPENRSAEWIRAFSEAGATIIHEPIYEMVSITGSRLVEARNRLSSVATERTWMAFSSVETVRHFGDLIGTFDGFKNVKWAAVGPATSSAMAKVGIASDLIGDGTGALALADLILDADPTPNLIHLTSNQGLGILCERVVEAGGNAEQLVISLQKQLENIDPKRWLLPVPPDLLTFASPGAARGLMEATPDEHRELVQQIPAVATGPTTAGSMKELGWNRVKEGSHLIGTVLEAAAAVLQERD